MNKFDTIKQIIETYLDKYIEVKYPESIYKSMRYTLLAGGKRLRGVLAVETALIYGAKIEEILPTACAIEMLHSQSLIHDDLPCIDNDDFRRGKPSNHKVFGESTATLAGDALLSYAPQIIINKTPQSVKPDTILRILNEFFSVAGVDGIVSGQIVDVDSEHKKISNTTLEYIYEYKTARLFKLALRAGAIIAKIDNSVLQNLTLFAQYYAHAFQIYDDILDETSTQEQLGNTPGKDKKSEKSTYVSMYGLKQAKEQVIFLCNKSYDILKKEGIESEIYNDIISDLKENAKK